MTKIMKRNKTKGGMSRRQFIGKAGLGLASAALIPQHSFPGYLKPDRKIRIGIIGGGFGTSFQFHEHPDCIVEAVSDLRPDRRDLLMKTYRCSKSYESLEKLILDPKVEAVFIATPATDHVRHSVAAIRAGKHVLSAVPAAMSLEECYRLKDAVQTSGLTYMMAETSYYRQNTISVRKMHKEGLFGDIFSAAAEYNHPGLETLWFENGKPTWRHGLPPLLYPTHCTAFLISVTGERLTNVVGMGWGDDSTLLKNNQYNNPFWNETAFFKTNRGKPFRVEVNWKGALRGAERGEWRGEKMSFFSSLGDGDQHTIVRVVDKTAKDDGGFKYNENLTEKYVQPVWWQTDMLPEPLRHASGHDGSHTFITHEFIDALIKNRRPVIDVHEALAYTAPGIVGHQSALRNGEYMSIPSFD
jgi:predicted dehydrogenase